MIILRVLVILLFTFEVVVPTSSHGQLVETMKALDEFSIVRRVAEITTMLDASESDRCSTFRAKMTALISALKKCNINFRRCSKDCRAFYKSAFSLPLSSCISQYTNRRRELLTLNYIRAQNKFGITSARYCSRCSRFSNRFEAGVALSRQCRVGAKDKCKKSCVLSYDVFRNLTAPSIKTCMVGYTLSGVQMNKTTLIKFISENRKFFLKCAGFRFFKPPEVPVPGLIIADVQPAEGNVLEVNKITIAGSRTGSNGNTPTEKPNSGSSASKDHSKGGNGNTATPQPATGSTTGNKSTNGSNGSRATSMPSTGSTVPEKSIEDDDVSSGSFLLWVGGGYAITLMHCMYF